LGTSRPRATHLRVHGALGLHLLHLRSLLSLLLGYPLDHLEDSLLKALDELRILTGIGGKVERRDILIDGFEPVYY
jgi:hypothetical protein